jgi:hypothetical protein
MKLIINYGYNGFFSVGKPETGPPKGPLQLPQNLTSQFQTQRTFRAFVAT